MKKLWLWVWVMLLASGLCVAVNFPVLAEDENELFGQDTTVKTGDDTVNNNTGADLQKKQISITGQVEAETTVSRQSPSKDWFGLQKQEENELSNQMTATLFADIRMGPKFKSFISFEASYFPEGRDELRTGSMLGPDGQPTTIQFVEKEYTDYQIKEFFIDTNIQNKVYIRTGKQVLKWGRCYFWNPTDLINVEQKDFTDLDKIREGAYGTRIHIPSGTKRNVYFYLSTGDALTTDQVSLTGKYEFLVGNTEMSFSAWGKAGNQAVGYDISSRLFKKYDLAGEVSYSYGEQNRWLNPNSFEMEWQRRWIPRASLGLTRYFDYGEIADRIQLTGEVYYNGGGYDGNIFRRIDTPSQKEEFLEKVYNPYRNSMYYVALFGSVQKFIISNITLNLNVISNLVDHSGALITGITYHPSLSDFYLDCNLKGNFGGDQTEATFSGETASLYLGLKLLF